MTEEVSSLESNRNWDLVPFSLGQWPLLSKWVFKTKTGKEFASYRLKARLIAHGIKQKEGLDYTKKHCTSRLLVNPPTHYFSCGLQGVAHPPHGCNHGLP